MDHESSNMRIDPRRLSLVLPPSWQNPYGTFKFSGR